MPSLTTFSQIVQSIFSFIKDVKHASILFRIIRIVGVFSSVGFGLLSFSSTAVAELQLGVHGKLHSSIELYGGGERGGFFIDTAEWGFHAKTPKGFSKFTADIAQLSSSTVQENAIHPAIEDAYVGTNLSDHWQLRLGLQTTPFGMANWDNSSLMIKPSSIERMSPSKAAGLTTAFKDESWQFAFGVYNPSYRSELVSTLSAIVQDAIDAPLYISRIGYQLGDILYVQASYALQTYFAQSTATQNDFTTEFKNIGIDMDISNFFGMLVNYIEVNHVYGMDSNHQTSTIVQFDWQFTRTLKLFVRNQEVYDADVRRQGQFFVGGTYTSDPHNRLVFNANLNGNNDKYNGFYGSSKESVLIEYQYQF